MGFPSEYISITIPPCAKFSLKYWLPIFLENYLSTGINIHSQSTLKEAYDSLPVTKERLGRKTTSLKNREPIRSKHSFAYVGKITLNVC